MKLIRLLLKNSWVAVTAAAFTGFLSGASSAGLIALINQTLRNAEIPISLAVSFVVLCLLLLVTTAASQVLIARLSQGVIFNLRMLLNQRILACPLRQLEEIGAPRLLATLTEDVEAISNASFSVATLCVNVAILVGCLLYLSWLSAPVFFLMLGFMTLGIFSHQTLVTKARRFLKLARELQDKLFHHFRTTTEGTKELKLHRDRRQAFLWEDLQSTAKSSQYYQVTGMSIFAFAASWGLLLFFIPIGLLIFVLPLLTNIPITVISGYALTIIFMITPLQGLLNTLPQLSRANIALNKIESLGLSLVEATEPELMTPINYMPEWAALELVGVTHAYRGEREESCFILGPMNLNFHPGEIVFIVGGNGSGKSTLVKLITGLYVPEAGLIQIDGKPVTDINREWYRQQFSAVFSDFYLFERLLGLGTSHIETQAQEYLEKLQLDHKVQIVEGTLSTTTALSQGQRKRLTLLTAYLENRPIYVFDEWASDQDPAFKEIFYTQLLPELKNRGKMVLVVSHDDRYFDCADRIVKLDYGQVVFDKHLHSL